MAGFGKRLKALRKEHDVTQVEVAKYVGLVSSAINKYENNENSYPSMDVLVKLSEYFNVSTDYLLKGVEPSNGIANNISAPMSNSPLIQTTGSGDAIYNGGEVLSPEAIELLNMYKELGGRERIKLLNFAVSLTEGAK